MIEVKSVKEEQKRRDGMRVTETESTVIMFGLDLPAGSFPLRSQQECKECCMRRKREKERRGKGGGDDDVKERNAKKEKQEGERRVGESRAG